MHAGLGFTYMIRIYMLDSALLEVSALKPYSTIGKISLVELCSSLYHGHRIGN